MTSIRRHILLWLMPGFLLLWLTAGSALYFSVKKRYEVELNGTLRELLAALPFGKPDGRTSLLSIEDFVKDDFGIYFQIWNTADVRILKSENLGRFELPKPELFSEDLFYRDAKLENGEPIRSLSVLSRGGSLGDLNIVVAKSREVANSSLRKVLIAIVGIGVASGTLFALLLSLAIRSGLRPLNEVGEKAAIIAADSLSERFPIKNIPGELEPIVSRLNDLMDRIQSSFIREKRFSADLAHELRTPVAALRSIAEVAIKWPEQATDENYHDIKNISGELQDTIESLLTLARLENAKEKLVIKPVNINELIRNSWEPFADQSTASQLQLINKISDEKQITTDPKLFQLILSNLFSNAIAYSPEGSTISIEDGPDSILTVKNPAPHLTNDDLDKMFDRLWRHDKARTDSGHSGLGLSIAKSSADLLSLGLTADLKQNFIHFTLKSL